MRRLAPVIAVLLVFGLVPTAVARDSGSVPKSPPRGAVLFTWGPSFRVYAVDADGGPLKELLPSFARPVWSPDGKMLAFTDDSPAGGIFLRRAGGSEVRLLARGSFGGLSWSPDGKRIAFSEWLEDPPTTFPPTKFGIGLIGVDGPGKRRLTTGVGGRDFRPAWSPDGKKIAFWRDRIGKTSDSLLVIDPDTGRLVATPLEGVNADRVGGGSLSWSPDGRRLAFSLPAELAVYVWNADNGARTTISADAETSLAWSPDGRWIALTGRVGSREGTFLVRPNGTGLRRISALGRRYEVPSWSPDSRWLAVEWRGDIWVIPATGGRARRLTQGWRYGYFNGDPQWNPRGLPLARLAGTVVPWGNPTDSAADGRVLRTTHPVLRLAADGSRVAMAYSQGPPFGPLGSIELWEPSGQLTRLRSYGDDGIALAGDRVAVMDHSVGGKGPSDFWTLWTATVTVPRVVQVRYQSSAAVTDLVGDAGLLVFTEWGPCTISAPCGSEPKKNGKLFRFQGSKAVQIASSSGALTPLSVDAGRILVDHEDGRLELMRADGSSLRTFRYEPGGLLGAKAQGRDLVLLMPGVIAHYDTETGERLHEWPLSGGDPRLEDLHGGVAVYVSGEYVHVVRLSDGRDVALPSLGQRPLAQLEAPGLFYAYRVEDAQYPGRVTFIPFDQLPLT